MYNEKIVAFYIRVSTTKQAKDGYSLEAQEEQAIKKAKEVFGEEVKWKSYIDSGKSAKDTTKRFELNKMMNEIKAGRIKAVITFKVSRLARNLSDALNCSPPDYLTENSHEFAIRCGGATSNKQPTIA